MLRGQQGYRWHHGVPRGCRGCQGDWDHQGHIEELAGSVGTQVPAWVLVAAGGSQGVSAGCQGV